MKQFLTNLFTEPDNQTWCIVKVLVALGTFTFLGLAIIHVVHNHSFDPQAFGVGFGALLAGGGGSLMMKKDTK